MPKKKKYEFINFDSLKQSPGTHLSGDRKIPTANQLQYRALRIVSGNL
jgi:hypothetical protein